MILTTTDALSSISFKIYPDFKPVTALALQWQELSSNRTVATDRGVDSDVYTTSISVKGTEAYIDLVTSFINNARKNAALTSANSYRFLMTSENDGEKIFGPDVSTTALQVVITDRGERKQENWKWWSLSMDLQAISPSFVGSASLPSSFNAYTGVKTFSSWDIVRKETYNGTNSFSDHNADVGELTFSIQLPESDMIGLLRYVNGTNRGESISALSWPVFHCGSGTNPFDIYGPRRDHLDYNFKITSLDSILYLRPGVWEASISIVEDTEA